MQLTETQETRRWYLVPLALGFAIALAWLVLILAFSDIWAQVLGSILTLQRDLQAELSAATRLAAQHGFAAAWTLIGLSFLYGVLHAAGPGHGKLVISTYLLSHEGAVRRSVALSVLSSLMQGVTAIVLMEAALAILGISMREATGVANKLELTSYALVVILGLILAAMTLRRFALRARNSDDPHACGHCGHSHAVDTPHIHRKATLTEMAAVIFSVGLRPCTGAILVLVLANILGLRFVAWSAVLAMSVGTAITVTALALAAVYARRTTLRLADRWPTEGRNLPVMLDAIAFCGGIAIVLLGVSLFQGAMATANHPLM
ncbi:MAG: nickel/cobalt transporter [Alphaproteobacteria bacterium]|nr:nickel/cobalt transporter [Alphaproteobacteria bacterium]